MTFDASSAIDCAARIEAHCRELAYQTHAHHRAVTLAHPADVYALLGELRQATGHLDQVARQLVMATQHFAGDARLRHDYGPGCDAVATAHTAVSGLQRAHTSLIRLYAALIDAQAAYGPLSVADTTSAGGER